jgi:hypothetical protein
MASTETASRAITEKPSFLAQVQRWRWLILALLLVIAIGYNMVLAWIAPAPDSNVVPFVLAWLGSFAPYVVAVVLILATGRAYQGRLQWGELVLILVGAAILRAQLVAIPPDLSHDSWRYLWDARVTLQGYSPYVYAPNDPLFVHLRDFLYQNSRFRNVPTIYPPAAEALYIVSYLLAPSNLFFFKGLLIVCDLVSSLLLALLLKRQGKDPAGCILYAWCPLPIVEFAIQGHVDAFTVMLMLLAYFISLRPKIGARILTGFIIALATLTKVYPVLMLVLILRRKDWALLATFVVTVVIAYTPYLILGHGQILGFFTHYAGEQSSPNAGPLTVATYWVSNKMHWSVTWEYIVQALVVGGTVLLVWIEQLRGRMSMQAGILMLVGIIFMVSTHIYPWYNAVFLPWVALLLGTPQAVRGRERISTIILACAFWYFVCFSVSSYLPQRIGDWNLYYLFVYAVVLLLLVFALLLKQTRFLTNWLPR